ncbi:hypothetical protein CBI38_33735 (plasmid) [Rhodococcus oxybenzonivorans]|uniref:Peptidase S8/S53 domain-containing protein n=1 Tax=Rhodococcus oxybenzonivorans TaxID=1990687 RepID=A0A2S2C684_9NOCA|nr:S8 family serine peptidase [Rhodococcus oxybenzonivorans]AWK76386.1 hypothetical protein CBI38_33735 [Rhodococcus oxybenzonivorans]
MIRPTADSSRESVDWFLQKRRPKQRAELEAAVGADVVAKLDPWIVHRILDEREESKFAQWTGTPVPDELPAHRVLINLASGKVRRREQVPKERRDDAVRARRDEANFSLREIRDDLARRGIEVEQEFWLTHSVQATLTTSEVVAIARRLDVSSIVSNQLHFAQLLDVSRHIIKADVMPVGITGAGVTVAILDTGVDVSHPSLAGLGIGAQQDMTGTAVRRDDRGHGTYCAGIVASSHTKYRGIAPGATVVDIRVMDGTGTAQPSWGVAGLAAAVTAGADVANSSWGFSHKDGEWEDPDGSCVLCVAADQSTALGVLNVVAAGNSGEDICGSYDTMICCPGMANNVLTVGSTEDDDTLSSFSSTGETPDGRLKPEVLAPGGDIGSLKATGIPTLPGAMTVEPGIIRAGGTSAAAPHIAGVAALILAKNPNLIPRQVARLIIVNTLRLPSLPLLWCGRIDALAAVNATPPP